MDFSVVEYFAEHEGYRCGYCKGSDTNYSHGMWAHALTVDAYEHLLNRGFRRSGKYLYKPTNHLTCCPCYTINQHVLEFKITKSQKKIIKKFNRYVLTGEKPKVVTHMVQHQSPDKRSSNSKSDSGMETDEADGQSVTEIINYREGHENVDFAVDQEESKPKKPELLEKKTEINQTSDQIDATLSPRSQKESVSKPEAEVGSGPSPAKLSKPKNQRKAKQIRLERKRQKLIAKGQLGENDTFPKTKGSAFQEGKALETLIHNEITNVELKLKLTTKLIFTKSKAFEAAFKTEHKLYQKYQTVIHKDAEDECSEKQFRRFLCDTPLITQTDSERGLEGSYHQQYWLGDKLIAVGVIDILCHVVSSVYFFYDPQYSFLSLGSYGALSEIAFTRKLHQTQPDIQFYYMGFYIHSCRKMRYKGAYNPSYLLCPEKFTWIKLDDELRKRLDEQKYQKLDTKPDTGNPNEEPRTHDIKKVNIFFRQCILPYPIYELKRGAADKEEIQGYCSLVGDEAASHLFLYRS